jgi:hypothetical protein
MKNLLMTLALVFSTMQLVAQTADNQHLMFKGVPVDGTLSEYVEKMKLVNLQTIKIAKLV